MRLYTYDEQVIRVLSVEFPSEYDANRMTLLVDRAAAAHVVPESVLKS